MPLRQETTAAFKQQRQAFRRKFGRDPNPEDPVFFDPDADTPQPMDMDVARRQIAEVMAKTGADPAVIYAFVKTGLIVTGANQDQLSLADRGDWEAAIREHREKTEGKAH